MQSSAHRENTAQPAAAVPGQAIDESNPSVTEVLGRWLAGLDYDALPAEVIANIKRCILDSLGCGLYGASQPWGAIAGNVAVKLSGGGPAALFGRAETVGPADAAMANGTAIHGFEIDDVHVASSFHPGSVNIPAALAVAEAVRAAGQGAGGRAVTGRDLLVAIVAGYEIGIRVGICAGVTHSTSGYHVTGTVGALGSSAAAARMLGLSPSKAAHALAIGATQASGLYAASKGAMAKRFHAGRASQSGVLAAFLAEQGFTGSRHAMEAEFGGFMSTLHGQSDPRSIAAELGTRWETARVGLKAYAACASTHSSVDAIGELMAEGLSAGNLRRLSISVSRKAKLNVGWPYKPDSVTAAQMNGYYTAAVKLLDGQAFIDQYREERIADPRILALIPKIDIIHDPEIDLAGAAKRHMVKAEAVLEDGRVLRATVEQRKGSAERPLSEAEVEAKFRRLAAISLRESEIDRLAGMVAELEDLGDIEALSSLIAAPSHR
jgi:2-methylcitrate dehydratase PrpD